MRTSLMMAGLALLCGSAAAQELEDVYPITAPIRHAGTVDLATGTWTRGSAQNAGNTVIFNNTCTWTGGAFYRGMASCEAVYDEGRLPSTGDPSAPVGAQNSYSVLCFSIAYCTFWANPFPVQIGFWDNLNGACVGGIPPTPPSPATTAKAYIDLTPLGLPGSATNGFQACWSVTIDTSAAPFTLLADGDGVFDNNPALDLFTWSFQHNNPTNAAGEDGMLINGDPNAAPRGSCSYSIPCGTDPFSGAPCGTGLGANDNEWVNVDNVAVGNSTTGPTICPGSPAGGTGCYFFGGYPTNPFASFWLTLEANTAGCAAPTTYCTAKTTSNGCVPSIGFNNLPSISAGNFQSTATMIEGATLGVFFYSTGGPNAQPFQGGFLCILPPVTRRPVQPSGGTFGTCTGNFTTNLTPVLTAVGVGNTIWGQYWFRDNQAATGTGLSNALRIVVCP